jgi:hypothetical protein
MRTKISGLQSQGSPSGQPASRSSDQPATDTASPSTDFQTSKPVQSPPRASEAVRRRLEAHEARLVAQAILAVEQAKARLVRLDKDCPSCVELSKTFARRTLEQAEAIIASTHPRIVREAKRLNK